jgi:hypothetical protein
MRRTAAAIGITTALFAGAPSSVAIAVPTRVAVDVGSQENEDTQAVTVRLLAELTAAGFETLRGAESADVRATLLFRGTRWVLFLELPDGSSLVVRADDVPNEETPQVLSLRAVERLRAALAAPSVPSASPPPSAPIPTPTLPSQPIAPSLATPPPRAPARILPPPAPESRVPFGRLHVMVAGTISIDDGALSVAPHLAAGLRLGSGFFVRVSGDGPSTETVVRVPEGSARVQSFGGAVDLGFAWAVRPTTAIGARIGAGGAGYSVAGEAAPGYVARSETRGALVFGLGVFLSQRLAGPLSLVLDAGARVAFPAVDVRVAGRVVTERGRPEILASPGVVFDF